MTDGEKWFEVVVRPLARARWQLHWYEGPTRVDSRAFVDLVQCELQKAILLSQGYVQSGGN